MSFQASTVQITVNVFDKNFLPLIADQIIIDGILVPGYTVANSDTATLAVRVQDNVTISVAKALYTAYVQIFDTHYGTDGNLEPIVVNVIMFPITTLAADLATFLGSFCTPVTRIKGTDANGDQYKLYATMNEELSYTVDWEYPVGNPIGVGQTVEDNFGAIGLKNVQVHVDDGLTNECTQIYPFILQNLNVNACYGQDIVAILDINNDIICQEQVCFEPFDFSQGDGSCCVAGLVEFKFRFKNLDDNAIVISPPDCLLQTEIVTGTTVFNFFTVTDFNPLPNGEYDVIIQLQPDPEACFCGLNSGTVWLSMLIEEGVGVCCNRTFDITANIQDNTFSLSNITVNLLTAVDDCVQGNTLLTNVGCANLRLPTITNVVDGCFEVDNIPVTIEYDAIQLAALPVDIFGDPYLVPSNAIDINIEYCPIQVEQGCCDAVDFIGTCNTITLEICYQSIVPPSCLEFLLMPCEDLKLSVPDSAETINEEPALTCVTPNIDLRFSGNAFFPPCDTVGCEGDPCSLTVSWTNITTGDSIPVQTFDPNDFFYSTTPVWNYILQFPSAGIWEAIVTATWCETELICTKQFTVCHDVSVKRLQCHIRRLSINTATDQDVTVLVESVFNPDFSATYTFNTGLQSFVDITLPEDDAYRITITFESDGTEKIIYIDEICSLAECYREMVLKIMCNETDPCCKNCDPKEVEKQRKLRYMVTQVMALFLSLTAFIHKDSISYLGVWEDDDCRIASQEEIARLIEALKQAILRCGVCEESLASQVGTSGCKNC